MMELDYLQMKNFRQYRDVKIDFSRSQQEKFTVIEGANGAGKTNILNAITWCLFGTEYHADSKYQGLPIVSTTALDESKRGIVGTSVEIQFIGDDGKKILISRSLNCRENAGKLTEVAGPHPQPCLMRQTERDWVGPIYGDDAKYIIETLVPHTIEEYFFFDGERMDDYFKENTDKEIKDSVFQISQLELFETLIEHLIRRKNDFVKETKGLSSEAENIREELDIHTRSSEVDKEQLEQLKKKKGEALLLERDFSDKLRNSSLEHIKSLEEQREIFEESIAKIQDDIVELEEERLKILHRSMPIIFAHGPLTKTKALIDVRREAGLIPPLYKAIFIKDLLKKSRCICDSDISEKDEYSSARRRKVEALLQDTEISEMSSELIESNVHIQEMLESLSSFRDEVLTVEKKLNALQQQKDEKNKRLRAISQEIKQSNVENIKNWEMQKQKYAEEKDRLIAQIGLKERDVERRQNIIRALNAKLKQELKKESKHNSLLGLLTFCEDSIKCAQEAKETVMREVKSQVEEKASEEFLALIWKKNTYQGVVIDDDYNISVPHVSGREALGTLSAGERQVCALSFMAALNSVSGFKVPVIMDTPLARISREPRKNIAENLPNYLHGTQVTLLVTEEEYTKEVKEALSKKVGKTYIIDFQEKGEGKIAEVRLVND
jgi:DNA sulfur modification protein DndD